MPTDPDFAAWLAAVNKLLFRSFQLTLDDLPDLMTRDAFESGQEPEDFFENEVRDLLVEEFGESQVAALWPSSAR